MRISVITLFPQMFSSMFNTSIIKRATEKKIMTIDFINLRDFGIGKHKLVDDTPYGGGAGMVLRVDVVQKAIESVKQNGGYEKIILLSAHGKQFNQKIARELSSFSHLIIVCGHYEGFDERIKKYADEELSIGDFIVTGGEIPAMLIIDSVGRLVSGVIKKESLENESFSPHLEYPQYTKPNEYNGQKVPNILLSGNHKKISEWRKEKSISITKKLRPDLIGK